MRKSTIAIILLLSVTAVFGQTPDTKTTGKISNCYPFVFSEKNWQLKFKSADTTFKNITSIELTGDTSAFLKEFGKYITKPDTVQVPVYLVDVTDTVPANLIYKKSGKSDRVYTVKGFALVRGFKVFVNGKAQWADKPQIVGALDDKKRLIKNVIQVI